MTRWIMQLEQNDIVFQICEILYMWLSRPFIKEAVISSDDKLHAICKTANVKDLECCLVQSKKKIAELVKDMLKCKICNVDDQNE